MKSRTKKLPPATTWIHLRDIEIRCILGIYPTERRTPRKVLVNIELATDITAAAKSDKIAHALNYEQIENDVRRIARQGRFFLIETLATRLADACLLYPAVQAVRVTVDKPRALRHTRSVAIEILKSK